MRHGADRKFLSLALLILLSLGSTSILISQESHRLTLALGGSVTSGNSVSDISIYTTAGNGMRSSLDFPLDAWAASVAIEYSRERSGVDEWMVSSLSSWKFTDPAVPFKDYDWIDEIGYLPILWSYTESSVTGLDIESSLVFSKRLGGPFFTSLYLSGGYGFQYLIQTAHGYEGWQYDLPTTGLPEGPAQRLESTEDALTYTFQNHSLILGALVRVPLLPYLDLDLKAAYKPGYLFDTDDHLLRKKIGTAQGFSHGFSGDAVLALKLPRRASGLSPSLSLIAGIDRLWISTTQTQEQYKDDPSLPGDQKGDTTSGLGYSIDAVRTRVGILAGISLGRR